ncbi:MAG TPA: Lrp/AsnC ligand binding domain-containing protein [Anaerolineales bacterium]|jgi:DNA-binding Lrp family transcriptional regulator|nr:Lrp/AsnC ligand binding domain-containing protein [Anaerolineales bacterium]
MNGFVSIFFNSQSTSKPTAILKKIANTNNVGFAYLVTGQVDAIAWVQASDSNAFLDTLLRINSISGVDRTSTNVAL